ncbi:MULTISPECIES: hypothetical protein [Chryseobacterium]|uniref:hypothetical protein n=1 Tax=Chryseobacterium TaxID=59732 RepID=UPI0016238C22|nr:MULTISPECIES: hypothetical protein [Chryseobacterium]MDM1553102.1 hypothetical protein [Chryseobacterium indologenes]
MKKSIILISFLSLFACAGDNVLEKVIPDQPRNVDISNTVSSIDPMLPYHSPLGNGLLMPGTPGGPYASTVEYIFINDTDFDLTIYPMVGLAYFDGQYNNNNFGWGSLSKSPNVFAGNQEYLRIFTCSPLFFAPHSYEKTKPSIQLPTLVPSIFPSGQYFNVGGINGYEATMLAEGGKFYGMEIGVGVPAGSPPVTGAGGWMKFRFLPDGMRDPRQVSQDWLPLPTNGNQAIKDYWYNKKTFEICPGNNPDPNQGNIFSKVPSERYFSQNGIDYVLKAYTTTTQFIISFTKV